MMSGKDKFENEINEFLAKNRRPLNLSQLYQLDDENLYKLKPISETIDELLELIYEYLSSIERSGIEKYSLYSKINNKDIFNHHFLVINRLNNSDPKDPLTWGNDALINDLKTKENYPAKNYQSQLKYISSIDDDSSMVEVPILQLEDFDLKKHYLQPSKKTIKSSALKEMEKTITLKLKNIFYACIEYKNRLSALKDEYTARLNTQKIKTELDKKLPILSKKIIEIENMIKKLESVLKLENNRNIITQLGEKLEKLNKLNAKKQKQEEYKNTLNDEINSKKESLEKIKMEKDVENIQVTFLEIELEDLAKNEKEIGTIINTLEEKINTLITSDPSISELENQIKLSKISRLKNTIYPVLIEITQMIKFSSDENKILFKPETKTAIVFFQPAEIEDSIKNATLRFNLSIQRK